MIMSKQADERRMVVSREEESVQEKWNFGPRNFYLKNSLTFQETEARYSRNNGKGGIDKSFHIFYSPYSDTTVEKHKSLTEFKNNNSTDFHIILIVSGTRLDISIKHSSKIFLSSPQ